MKLCGVVCLAFSPVVFAQTYTISTFAGGGPPDSAPGTSVPINPVGTASDAAGNLFITTSESVLRLDAATGILSKVAGFGGLGIAVDSSGNLYIAESSVVVKYSHGIITTVAGDGTRGYGGDNGPATSAQLNGVFGVAVDAAGNLYLADSGNQRIRKVSNGVITTIAGSAVCTMPPGLVYVDCPPGFSGDNGPATNAQLAAPVRVAIDGAGNLYVVDNGNARIRKVSNGVITTVAGGGAALPGDNGPATSAWLFLLNSIAADSAGNVYITDNHRIRKIANGIITTVAGGDAAGYTGDNGPAVGARLNRPDGVTADAFGNVYILDQLRVRKVFQGIITTVAGNGTTSFSGDGGPATDALLDGPSGVAVDAAGNVYIADSENNRIRKVSNGIITTVAGGGVSADDGPATGVALNDPTDIAVDSAGNVYIADSKNYRIRKLSDGVITTVAGNGNLDFSGENIPAVSATIGGSDGIAVDRAGVIYFTERGHLDRNGRIPARIRKVANGVISTVAGNGTEGFSGDNGPATGAQLDHPSKLAVDSAGDLYIADVGNYRIRKVSNGVITTVVGNGGFLFSGDGGPATSAQGDFHSIAFDSADNLYVSDSGRIRKVSNGVIQTAGSAGDNGLAVDAAGRVYAAGNNIIRVLTPTFLARNSASTTPIALAPNTIAMTEASGIAPGLIPVPGGAWPTILGGVSLEITDSQGVKRLAPIGSVSTSSMSYLIPAATALGPASVKLTASTGSIVFGLMQINRLSPGLYSANASGSGVAAGMWIRTSPDGVDTTGYLFDPLLPVGSRYGIGFDQGPASDRVFLSLHGTGFRSANQVTAMVAGVSVPVSFVGPAGGLEGEDVVNIGPLPSSMVGGDIPIVLTFDGQQANTVTFSIRAARGRPTERPPAGGGGRR